MKTVMNFATKYELDGLDFEYVCSPSDIGDCADTRMALVGNTQVARELGATPSVHRTAQISCLFCRSFATTQKGDGSF